MKKKRTRRTPKKVSLRAQVLALAKEISKAVDMIEEAIGDRPARPKAVACG